MGNNITSANGRQSQPNSRDITTAVTANFETSLASNDSYHNDDPSLSGLSLSTPIIEDPSSSKHGSDTMWLNSGSYKASVIPSGRPKSLRTNKLKDGILPGKHDPLSLEVPESNEEIPPSPEMSPLPKNPGRFSPFLASHYAAPVPDKALFGRAPFQSPITNKISGPFRLSSPLNSNSPMKKMPRPNSFGSRSKVFQGNGIAANSPHI